MGQWLCEGSRDAGQWLLLVVTRAWAVAGDG